MNSNIFITGGAGFIGSKLSAALLRRGERVTVFDNMSTGRPENVAKGAHLIVGDITNPEALTDAIAGHDKVIHLAARVAIRSSFEYIVEDTFTNVVGTAALMRAIQKTGGIRRCIAASSMAVYADSNSPRPICESYPSKPLSPYGISKLALEQLVHTGAHSCGVESVVLRFFNTYGSGQALSPYVGAVTIFATALAQGLRPIVFGDGQQSRDFVHVDDVVNACILALDSNCSDQTYNVGTGEATTINRVVELVQSALRTSIEPIYKPPATGELRYSVANISRAKQELGYRPERSLHIALPDVVREIAGLAIRKK